MQPHTETVRRFLLEAAEAQHEGDELVERGQEVLEEVKCLAARVGAQVTSALQGDGPRPAFSD